MMLLFAALAVMPAADDTNSPPRDAQACPAVFGSEEIVKANEAFRKNHLHAFAVTDKRVEITHSVAKWKAPAQVRVPGLDLVDVYTRETDAHTVALVSIDETLKSLCEPGLYEVHADDALGQSGQVLVVDPRGVLVEQGGKLAFLPWKGHPVPKDVRIVWRSPYNIVMESTSKGTGKGSSSKRKAKKRSSKKKKRKRGARKGRK